MPTNDTEKIIAAGVLVQAAITATAAMPATDTAKPELFKELHTAANALYKSVSTSWGGDAEITAAIESAAYVLDDALDSLRFEAAEAAGVDTDAGAGV